MSQARRYGGEFGASAHEQEPSQSPPPGLPTPWAHRGMGPRALWNELPMAQHEMCTHFVLTFTTIVTIVIIVTTSIVLIATTPSTTASHQHNHHTAIILTTTITSTLITVSTTSTHCHPHHCHHQRDYHHHPLRHISHFLLTTQR